MNERTKELAEQAGWDMGDEVCGFTTRLEKFAELVRADEREACAMVAEEMERNRFDSVGDPRIKTFESQIAKAIRARSEK